MSKKDWTDLVAVICVALASAIVGAIGGYTSGKADAQIEYATIAAMEDVNHAER